NESGAGDTLIAQGVRVEGEFVSAGNVVIEGEVHGSVSTSEHLEVGHHAKIVANVKAATALVAGTIEGDMEIAGRLELKSTSHITGDLVASDLVIESGAVLNGKITMGDSKAGSQSKKRGADKEAEFSEDNQSV
ncbi:MAG: polymer-forming cytoskeletal protein, partial [bacterium]